MEVKNEIKDTTYIKLIEYASKKCDTVMFVTVPWHYKRAERREQEAILKNTTDIFERELKKDFLKKRDDGQWVFTIEESGVPGASDHGFGIYFYKFSDTLTDFLLTNKNLYEWNNPYYPQDISLFKNGYCWLYSIADEDMCFIYCENEEEYEYLKSIGVEFSKTEFVPTPKKDLYFEKYW